MNMTFSLVAGAAVALASSAQVQNPAPGTIPLSSQVFRTGFNSPVQVVASPVEPGLLYVVEKPGVIRALRTTTTTALGLFGASTPFVVNPTGEGGMLSMAFDPNFATNHFIYVFAYGRVQGETADSSNVLRFTESATVPGAFDPSSMVRVMSIPRSAGIHYGGWTGFGNDNLLYVSVGEAGGSTNSITLTSPLGKILRIDPSRDDYPNDPLKNFGVPAGNPYIGTANALPEIFAVGVRNPWRCSFDRATGDLWIGDVGSGTAGAIYCLRAGVSAPQNFGWPCYDRGSTVLQGGPVTRCTNLAPLSPSLLTYDRNYGGSLTGGVVYRGCAMPLMRGRYIFADYLSGAVTSAKLNADGTLSDAQAHTVSGSSWSAVGTDSAGEIYLASYGGFIVKLVAPVPWGRDLDANGTLDSCQGAYCGIADVARLGGAPGPDGQLTADDLTAYLSAFFAGNLLVADLSRVGGFTQADAELTSDDLIVFLGQFFAGCP